MKWLEDELELNALHNPGSRRGSGNEKAALTQRAALSAALGGRVDVAAMTTISGASIFPILFYCFSNHGHTTFLVTERCWIIYQIMHSYSTHAFQARHIA